MQPRTEFEWELRFWSHCWFRWEPYWVDPQCFLLPSRVLGTSSASSWYCWCWTPFRSVQRTRQAGYRWDWRRTLGRISKQAEARTKCYWCWAPHFDWSPVSWWHKFCKILRIRVIMRCVCRQTALSDSCHSRRILHRRVLILSGVPHHSSVNFDPARIWFQVEICSFVFIDEESQTLLRESYRERHRSGSTCGILGSFQLWSIWQQSAASKRQWQCQWSQASTRP